MPPRHPFYLVLDVGTTSVKTLLFDRTCSLIERVSFDLSKAFPKRGWVEQDPEELLRISRRTMRVALKKSGCHLSDCLGMGITNQRETTILWETGSGKAIYPLIVWEDQRTKQWCKHHSASEQTLVRSLTGLSIEPYFSASKIRWILDHVPKTRTLLQKNTLRFGTVDTWLLWNMTRSHAHLTDQTNAARTLLFDIRKRQWDHQLLELFDIPPEILPKVRSGTDGFGILDHSILGQEIPILAICGDQQSSFYAAAYTTANEPITKVTCGTGTFISQSTHTFQLHPGFYTTIAPHPTRQTVYVLESKIQRGGKQVEPLLKNPSKLTSFLENLADDIEDHLKRLPIRPREIVLDGGVTRDGILQHWIEKKSHVKVVTLPLFDGTGLGTAFLCRDHQARRKGK